MRKSKPKPIPGHVGPFPAHVNPARPGIYKRVSPKTGQLVYAYWDGFDWSKFSSNYRTAKTTNRYKAPSIKSLPWYGMAK